MICLLCGEEIARGAAVLPVMVQADNGIFTTMQSTGFVHLQHLADTLAGRA